MRLFLLLVFGIIHSSCGEDLKTDSAKEEGVTKRGELSLDSKIFLGNRLFSEKTCITCHDVHLEKKGPSVIDIMHVYKEKNASIELFLRGKSKPIVDTTASQVAIMQDNINGFLQKVTDEDLNAIATYMLHVKDLTSK
ncbi:MAG: c-type cytochrome [Flavobacteriales bacterium]|nr:c-type cytochrome [Flavobacteriales bacterium]